MCPKKKKLIDSDLAPPPPDGALGGRLSRLYPEPALARMLKCSETDKFYSEIHINHKLLPCFKSNLFKNILLPSEQTDKKENHSLCCFYLILKVLKYITIFYAYPKELMM